MTNTNTFGQQLKSVFSDMKTARENAKMEEAEAHKTYIQNRVFDENKVLLKQIYNKYKDIKTKTCVTNASLYSKALTQETCHVSDSYGTYNKLYFGFNAVTQEPELTSIKKPYYFQLSNIYGYNTPLSSSRSNDMKVIKERYIAFCDILEANGLIFDYDIPNDIIVYLEPVPKKGEYIV